MNLAKRLVLPSVLAVRHPVGFATVSRMCWSHRARQATH
jgi:hypothetical protein